MKPIQLFCGFDEREAPGFHAFVASVIRRASKPVAITPLASMGMPMGSNHFTLSRFLVPALCGFKGHAIFVDGSDMLCLADIAELDALFNDKYAVQCVKHPDYDSQHARKYIGTDMECDQSVYSRKNWASVVIFNCEHSAWRGVGAQEVCERPSLHFLQFQNLLDQEIGSIPAAWNVLIDEGQDDSGAKLLHWSNGIPSFPHYKDSRRSKTWFNEFHSLTGRMDG